MNRVHGRFVRKHHIWTFGRWGDGYKDKSGRFRVYRPDYPRAYHEGYAMRSHVVWWLTTGSVHPKGWDVHHKNRRRLDDRFDNLEIKRHKAHSEYHHPGDGFVKLVCRACGRKFKVTSRKLNARKHEGLEIKFCSQKCYHRFPKSDKAKAKTSLSLKIAWSEGRHK